MNMYVRVRDEAFKLQMTEHDVMTKHAWEKLLN